MAADVHSVAERARAGSSPLDLQSEEWLAQLARRRHEPGVAQTRQARDDEVDVENLRCAHPERSYPNAAPPDLPGRCGLAAGR
jgi:hypothetical protein